MADAVCLVASLAATFLLGSTSNSDIENGADSVSAHQPQLSPTTAARASSSFFKRRRRSDEAPIRISLLLSLLLFSLGMLEATPSSWLLFLDNSRHHETDTDDADDDDGSSLSGGSNKIELASAYRLLLWADCVYIAVIVPAALGILLIFKFVRSSGVGNSNGSDVKDDSSRIHMRERTIVGRIWHIMYSFVRLMTSLTLIICRSLTRRMVNGIRGRQQGQLPLVRSMSQMSVATGECASTRFTKRTLFFGSLLGLACSFASLRTFGTIVTEVEEEMESKIALKVVVSQICALGVIISSLLAGFGSVSMPYTCLAGLYLPNVSDQAVMSAKEDYNNVTRAMGEKRRSLEEMQAHRTLIAVPAASTPPASSGVSFFRRRCGLPRTNSSVRTDDYQVAALKDDISYLQTLSEDLRDEIEEMKFVQSSAKRARTPLGRIMGWLGVIFSIVLLVRVGLAILAVMSSGAGGRGKSSRRRTDPITLALSFLTGYRIVEEEQYNTLSQLSSLLLTGFLSMSQVRVFFRTISALNRRFGCLWKSCSGEISSIGTDKTRRRNQNHFLNSSSGVWLISAIMGSFFLCCLVLIKMNLPREYRSGFSLALKGFDFAFDVRVTNSVFAFSAIISAVVLGMLFGIRRQASSLHTGAITASTGAGRLEV